MSNLVLSDLHKALLSRCDLCKTESTLMIDAPTQEVADGLLALRNEWMASGSQCRVFYLYVKGNLMSEFSFMNRGMKPSPMAAGV
ncbi:MULTISPECIES: hypothetical protein [unclassified Leptolyngbya]|uniref:hypothetical protein n=1 Tax=unclassified Leptolyngbya TaxID=2650499 RepID=UPI001683CD8D|nr:MULTISPECIES: hypothetical protein [unclassified Leptolyngbya]MBD1913627.1 hypothetical protein [Leptolyngbya sp. FACHB-8]MBD2154042.1 hypothetical protein [Leptolyngbya sp. FACHB-16]